jgi:hypothetical protein
MMRGAAILLLGCGLLGGCSGDACRLLAPALEVRVVAGPGVPVEQVKSLEVAVRAGSFAAERSYPISDQLADGETSLVVNVGEAGREGFQAEVTVTARNAAGEILIVASRSFQGSADGCNFGVLPLSCSDDAGVYPELLLPARGCWDVSGVFRVANHAIDPSAMRVFGLPATPGDRTENVSYALLAGAGDPELPLEVECTFGSTTIKTAKSWSIVRKPISGHDFALSVRGNSKRDCDGSGKALFPPVNEGEIQLNRGWRIKSFSCAKPTTCTALVGGTSFGWRNDYACQGCCACPEGARVNADLVVTRP